MMMVHKKGKKLLKKNHQRFWKFDQLENLMGFTRISLKRSLDINQRFCIFSIDSRINFGPFSTVKNDIFLQISFVSVLKFFKSQPEFVSFFLSSEEIHSSLHWNLILLERVEILEIWTNKVSQFSKVQIP